MNFRNFIFDLFKEKVVYNKQIIIERWCMYICNLDVFMPKIVILRNFLCHMINRIKHFCMHFVLLNLLSMLQKSDIMLIKASHFSSFLQLA